MAEAEACTRPPLRKVASTSAVTLPVAPWAQLVWRIPVQRPVADVAVQAISVASWSHDSQSPETPRSLTPGGTFSVSRTVPVVPWAWTSTPMAVAWAGPEMARPTRWGVVATVVVGDAVGVVGAEDDVDDVDDGTDDGTDVRVDGRDGLGWTAGDRWGWSLGVCGAAIRELVVGAVVALGDGLAGISGDCAGGVEGGVT